MKRKKVAELFLEECPNCGAPRENKAAVCRFCGTSLAVSKLIEEDVVPIRTPVSEDGRKIAMDNEHREPDIRSTAIPGEKKSKYIRDWKVAFVAITLALAISAICVAVVILEAGAGMIVGISCAFLVALIIGIRAFSKAERRAREVDEAMENSPGYPAVIVQVRQRNGYADYANGKLCRQIKVVADIDGKDTCILLLADDASDALVDSLYPIGGEVRIVGSGNRYEIRTIGTI
ncbi:MAG: hypothetical protein IKI15_00240 [Lachnospiraceae bacterium]|nr:hypothetical protein [Lachnospiraceae bacterium]